MMKLKSLRPWDCTMYRHLCDILEATTSEAFILWAVDYSCGTVFDRVIPSRPQYWYHGVACKAPVPCKPQTYCGLGLASGHVPLASIHILYS